MNQQQIDELLQSDADEKEGQESVQNEAGKKQEPMAEEYEQTFSDLSNKTPHESRREEDENIDEILSQATLSEFKFRKDDDMSEAQSEFVDSSKLNVDKLGLAKHKKVYKDEESSHKGHRQDAMKEEKQTDKVKKKGTVKAGIKKQSTAGNREQIRENKVPVARKQKQRNHTDKKTQAVQSEEEKKNKVIEIESRIKVINEEKQHLLEFKLRKQKNEEEMLRLEYEEAKRAEEIKKERNRLAMQEQVDKKGKNIIVKGRRQPENADKKSQEIKTEVNRQTTNELKAKRKTEQENIKKLIAQRNRVQLKELNNPKRFEADRAEQRKAKFLEQRQILKARQVKQRQLQAQQCDTVAMKQLKKEINECRKLNQEKLQQIHRADINILDLTKELKEKEKLLYEGTLIGRKTEDIVDLSALTPIELFVHSFPQADTPEQIFRLIDANADGCLSLQQIRMELAIRGVEDVVAKDLIAVLDANSDGNITLDQFVFIVELQIKKQKDYRQIMGEVDLADPLDLQAKILDMQAKINYINQQLAQGTETAEAGYQRKCRKLEMKIEQVAKDNSKVKDKLAQEGGISDQHNSTLASQYLRLRNEREMQWHLLQKCREKFKENLSSKNCLLATRIEEGLRMHEEIYRARNEIQEAQLRYLSTRKIEDNKRGYLARQCQQQKELDQAHRRTIEYQLSVTDPTHSQRKAPLASELNLLAAVIMIQRNYRRRKAQQQLRMQKQGHP